MTAIKFGTDGWRAIIAKDFTTENVSRIATGTALWLKNKFDSPSVVIGHDCRFAGELFAETAARTFAANGIKVFLAKGFVSTPMISLGAKKLNASAGVIITASHNPPGYSGYKVKGHYGGPLLADELKAIEQLIPENAADHTDSIPLKELKKKGLLEYVDLEAQYAAHARAYFDLEAIQNPKLNLAYDAMYGSGQGVMKQLLPDIHFFRCENDPTFQGISPEPIAKNLGAFSEFIKSKSNIDCGLATDGDADRLGLMDKSGDFIDSHHIMLLLIHYLCKYKGWKGKVATGFSSTVKIHTLCRHYGLELEWVPIGFKHICGIMLKEDILLGGEESGGIAIRGHIPERDGIWNGLVIWELMAKSGKSLNQLIDEVYAITGPFAFERIDLSIAEADKTRITEACKSGQYTSFGKYNVQEMQNMDGHKFILSENEWVMIRASGTEPVLRTYAEAATKKEALSILNATHQQILS